MTTLRQCPDFEAAWRQALAPWFTQAARDAWRQPGAWVVLTPSRSLARLLKARLLDDDGGCANVAFWTVGECRRFLAGHLAPETPIATREQLHLLLGMAAEEASRADDPMSRAIAADPSALMQALDRLADTGWDAPATLKESLEKPLGRLLDTYQELLQKTGLVPIQPMDRRLLAASPASLPAIHALLIAGFNGAHWADLVLLQAAVRHAGHATVCLETPRLPASRSSGIDQRWVATWEEIGGESEHADRDPEAKRPFAPLAERMERQEAVPVQSAAADQPVIHLAADLLDQARALVAQAVRFLAEPHPQNAPPRLGIVLPSAGILAREVALGLQELGLPHFDSFGRNSPPLPDAILWKAWLAFQEKPGLDALERLLLSSDRLRQQLTPPFDAFREQLERAHQEVLLDNLELLAAQLELSSSEVAHQAAAQLRQFQILPEMETFRAFLQQTLDQIAAHGLGLPASVLEAEAAPFTPLGGRSISRRTFLRWLAENMPLPERSRDAAGNHPLARIHLLPYDQAEGQSWTHLLLGGMNEGHWPLPAPDSGYLSEARLAELNTRAGRAAIPLKRDEGTRPLHPGKGLLLTRGDHQQLAQRRFLALLESPTRGLALAASLADECDPERRLQPNLFLLQTFASLKGAPLDEKAMEALRRHTAAGQAAASEPTTAPAPRFETTQRAHEIRRAEQPFGEFDFGLKTPPSDPPRLGCKEWEEAFQFPAIVWMRHWLGVEEISPLGGDRPWSLAIGTWVHQWLAPATRHKTSALTPAQREAWDVEGAARRTLEQVGQAYQNAELILPDWWRAAWSRARWIARDLADRVMEQLDEWPCLGREVSLPPDGTVSFRDAGHLSVKGRMDLVMAKSPVELRPGQLDRAANLWILDFKTGAARKLAPAELAKGDGIQLALYAMALLDLGAREVRVSGVSPGVSLAPGRTATELREMTEPWATLARMQRTGIFGMKGAWRSEFGRQVRYPLATLEIPEDILEQRWALTHPASTEEEPA